MITKTSDVNKSEDKRPAKTKALEEKPGEHSKPLFYGIHKRLSSFSIGGKQKQQQMKGSTDEGKDKLIAVLMAKLKDLSDENDENAQKVALRDGMISGYVDKRPIEKKADGQEKEPDEQSKQPFRGIRKRLTLLASSFSGDRKKQKWRRAEEIKGLKSEAVAKDARISELEAKLLNYERMSVELSAKDVLLELASQMRRQLEKGLDDLRRNNKLLGTQLEQRDLKEKEYERSVADLRGELSSRMDISIGQGKEIDELAHSLAPIGKMRPSLKIDGVSLEQIESEGGIRSEPMEFAGIILCFKVWKGMHGEEERLKMSIEKAGAHVMTASIMFYVGDVQVRKMENMIFGVASTWTNNWSWTEFIESTKGSVLKKVGKLPFRADITVHEISFDGGVVLPIAPLTPGVGLS